MNIDIKKYNEEKFSKIYLGNFQNLKINTFLIDFSYDFNDYYTNIGIPGFYHHFANSNINRFIDNCLIIGNFLYISDKFGIYENDISFNCTTTFCFLKKYKRDSINLRIILSAQKNGKVFIELLETYDDCKKDHDLYVTSRNGLPWNLLEILEFKPYRPCMFPDGYYYEPIKNKFNPPYYDNLPLYINVPFIKEYARHMFKIGPPPPITFDFSKSFMPWI